MLTARGRLLHDAMHKMSKIILLRVPTKKTETTPYTVAQKVLLAFTENVNDYNGA